MSDTRTTHGEPDSRVSDRERLIADLTELLADEREFLVEDWALAPDFAAKMQRNVLALEQALALLRQPDLTPPDAHGLIRNFLSRLPYPDRLPAAEVSVEDDGDLDFSWGIGGRVVTASVSPIGVVQWAALVDDWKACGHFTLPAWPDHFNVAMTRIGEALSGLDAALKEKP